MIPYTTCMCFVWKPKPVVWTAVPTTPCTRRGGISLERTDRNALYIRMLGDVRGRSRLDKSREKRSISLSDSDYRLLEALELSEVRQRPTGRFLSLPRHRLRRQPYKFENKANSMLIDDIYTGQTKRLLSKVGRWNFSTFALHNMTSGRPVVHLCNYLFQQYGLIDHFKLDYVKMLKCFTLIEDGYHSNNPYHNVVHAADVTQAMHCYLQEAKINKACSPLEIMSALIAAVCHDLDHPGVNQAFLIATSNHLAALYKNSSVLENHHWRLSVTALHQSGIFDHLNSSDRSRIEWQVKSLILATDITRQNEFLTRFKRHLDQGDLNLYDTEHRHFILQIAVKCADISNPCRSWDLSKRWSERVCEEFFQQGDLERHLKLSVTPLCDRFGTTVAKIQSGFMQFVVLPLFQEWKRFLPTPLSLHMLQNVETNRNSWESIIRDMNESQMKLQKPATIPVPAEESSSEEEEEEEEEEVVVEPKKVSAIEQREELIATLENVSVSLLLGRRHSVPLSIPKLEPRTIMRRESFPTVGKRTFFPRTQIFHSTSADRISEKVTVRSSPMHGCTSLESITRRPKITSLTSSASASRLSSAYAAQGTVKNKFLRRASTPARFLGSTEFGKHSKPTFHKSPLVSERVQYLVAKSREPSVSSTTDSESSSSSTFPLATSLPPRHTEYTTGRFKELRSTHSVVSWAESPSFSSIKRRSSDSFDSRRRGSDSYDNRRRGSGGVDPQEAINVLSRRGSGECQRQNAGSENLLQRRGSAPLMPLENLLNRRCSEPQEGLGLQELPRRGSEPLDLFRGLIRRHSDSQESLGILSDDAFRQGAGCLEAVLGGLLGAQQSSQGSQESLVDLLHRRHSAPQGTAEWVASAMAAREQHYAPEGIVPTEEELLDSQARQGTLEILVGRSSDLKYGAPRFSNIMEDN